MPLITLKAYAEQHGKDPRACRRKAANGGFVSARKVGRDWIIDSDEQYIDGRHKIKKEERTP